MFTLVVIGVAIGVFAMYFRHDRKMRRKRSALPAPGAPRDDASPPDSKPS